MTTEQDRAQMEAERNVAEDEYFEGQPYFEDCNDDRITYASAYERGWNERNKKVMELQARIDELMLEYCPKEMSVEQIVEWSKRQQPKEPT